MILSGAEMVLACRAEIIDVIFGFPCGACVSPYDAIYKKKMKHILTRHEQVLHAADGYARCVENR